MTHQHFTTLSQDKQYRNLLMNGVCIAHRDIEDHCVLLFQINNFYVEIFFDQNCDEIIQCRSFQNLEELDPYLNQINISHLV
jgi:hypothetical protein